MCITYLLLIIYLEHLYSYENIGSLIIAPTRQLIDVVMLIVLLQVFFKIMYYILGIRI